MPPNYNSLRGILVTSLLSDAPPATVETLNTRKSVMSQEAEGMELNPQPQPRVIGSSKPASPGGKLAVEPEFRVLGHVGSDLTSPSDRK